MGWIARRASILSVTDRVFCVWLEREWSMLAIAKSGWLARLTHSSVKEISSLPGIPKPLAERIAEILGRP